MIRDIRGNVDDYLEALAEDDDFLSAFDRINAAVEFGQRQRWTTHDIAALRKQLRKFLKVRNRLDVKAWCQFAHHRYNHAPAVGATAEVLNMLYLYDHDEEMIHGNAL